ncbi:MAG: RidA family protein [Rikenellaceae bacterium]|nr:RidA family protein [Rikenellaceae bacterium]
MKKIVSTKNAPEAVGTYSQAVENNGTIYVSGQLPLDPATNKMPEAIQEQTEQCLKNISSILEEAGYSLDNVAKTTGLLDDLGNFAEMNKTYVKFFQKDMPARVCYQVVKLPMGAKVEIDVIAVK